MIIHFSRQTLKKNVEEKLEETLKGLDGYKYFYEDEVKDIIYSCENLEFSSNMT